MQKRWNILNPVIPQNIRDVTEAIMSSRKFTLGDLQNNKNPYDYALTHKNFTDLINVNIKNAVDIISQTIKANKPIIIHGDYDADGQTATAILFLAIKNDLKYQNVFTYIPNRFDEGYGLSAESIEGMTNLLHQNNFDIKDALIITVDCGIVSHHEVELAKQKGFKIIITDHHQTHGTLPKPDELVWTTNATGAGIAWLISQSLLKQNNLNLPTKYLALAMIGTICDLQPLTEFNRQVARYGLQIIQNTNNLGLKALIEIAQIKLPIDTYHIGWVIGPRLNATGRLENASDSLNLLLTDDTEKAKKYAVNLNDINITRQNKTQNDFEFALKEFNDKKSIPNFIVSASDQYHEGIIGLVAGKLMQKYNRPAIAVSIDNKENMAKGSARSIKGISIIKMLQEVDHLFMKLGGHDMAAGFSIKTENIEKLKKILNEKFTIDEKLLTPQVDIEMEIEHDLINLELFNALSTFHPFGVDNSEPIFLTKNVRIVSFEKFGKENAHLKLFLNTNNNKKFTAVMWNAPFELSQNIGFEQLADLVFSLGKNEWNGNTYLDIKIKDIDFK